MTFPYLHPGILYYLLSSLISLGRLFSSFPSYPQWEIGFKVPTLQIRGSLNSLLSFISQLLPHSKTEKMQFNTYDYYLQSLTTGKRGYHHHHKARGMWESYVSETSCQECRMRNDGTGETVNKEEYTFPVLSSGNRLAVYSWRNQQEEKSSLLPQLATSFHQKVALKTNISRKIREHHFIATSCNLYVISSMSLPYKY